MVRSTLLIFIAVQVICSSFVSAEVVNAPIETPIPSPTVLTPGTSETLASSDPDSKLQENAEENSVAVSGLETKAPELGASTEGEDKETVKISQVTQKLLDSKAPGASVNIVQSSPLATSIVDLGRPVPTKKTKSDTNNANANAPATQVPLKPLAAEPTSPTATAIKPSGLSNQGQSSVSAVAPTANAAKGPNHHHLSSPIPPNHLSSPHNSGSLVLPGSGGKGPEGYTYVAASGSADLASSDKFQSQVFGWSEAGGQASPTLTGAGGQLGFGAGAAIDNDIVQGQLGLSFGGTTGLGFSSPSHSHHNDHGHGGDHQQSHSSGGGGAPGPNIFGFLQSLPAPFSALATAGSGGYEKLDTVAKPLPSKESAKPGSGLSAGGRPEKQQDTPKPPSPPGIFGIFSPFSTFSTSILSDDDDESEEEKQGPGGGGSTGTSSLFGILESLPTFSGNTEGSLTIQGGANIKPFLPFLNKPLCPEALELCINSCRELGKSGGILSQGNKCHCSCPVPDHLAGGNLCSNKYTSHCNKFCRTNPVTSYESGHCNSVTGECECKSPLGKPCFGSGHHH